MLIARLSLSTFVHSIDYSSNKPSFPSSLTSRVGLMSCLKCSLQIELKVIRDLVSPFGTCSIIVRRYQ